LLHSKKPPFGGFYELLLLIFLVAGARNPRNFTPLKALC
jgi:hypothetical protein